MSNNRRGQQGQQNNGGNVQMKNETMVSTIKFCRVVGINNPQQMYQLLQKKQVPESVLQYQQVGDKFQPFFKLESATKWWNERKAKNAAKRSQVVVDNTQQVISRFTEMVDEVGKTDPEVAQLAELLKKVFAAQGGEN